MENWYVWYLSRENETAGPLTLEHLKEQVAQGKILATDLIRKAEDDNFKKVSQFPDLFPDSNITDLNPKTEVHSSFSRLLTKINIKSVLITVLVGMGVIVLLAISIPYVLYKIDSSRRLGSRKNIWQIGVAIHSYHETHYIMPPGGLVTAAGEPYQSWQTFLLPYLNQGRLYHRIDFERPWNDFYNISKFKSEIPEYLIPGIKETISAENLGLSHYVGNKYVMVTTGTRTGQMRFRGITDGLASTIFFLEKGENFKPWGDPTNVANPVDIMGVGNKTPFIGGNHVMFGDGSVRFISNRIDPELLKALSTPRGGERLKNYKN